MPLLARPLRAVTKLVLVLVSSILLLLLITRTDVVSVAQIPAADVLLSLSSSLQAVEEIPGDMANASSAVDLGWYAPAQTLINNLTHVASADTTGVYGFIYNSSEIPADVAYGGYNWCNMPHVRASEYVRPAEEYELVYVELVSSLPTLIPSIH